MEVHLKRTLFKIGGSVAITIPDEIAVALDLKEGDEIELDAEKEYFIGKKVK
jgi:antitoxin component of MazEF toxin-antitoxin module